MKLHTGDKAPDFKVKDQDGNDVILSAFKGKKVVLYFYPKDMTPGCTAEACNLRDNYKLLRKEGYEVLGVSTDNEKSHQKFIAKEKLPFRLLADTDRSLHEKYGTWIEKSMYGRKYMGTARVTFVINEDGRIEEIIEKVDTRGHASQILKKEKDPVSFSVKSNPKPVKAKPTTAKMKPLKKVVKKAKGLKKK